jgi:hypothetical protein
METLLKKPEIFRDSMGRFDRHGNTLSKTAKKTGLIKKTDKINREIDGRYKNGGARPGAGRPKGSQNKVSLQLKEVILHALDKLGGADYLVALGRENSSAFASLLGKVLPTQLAASESNGGAGVELRFVREIVYPSGQRHIEGVTPKQLPAPDATHALPKLTDPTDDTNKGAVR